MDAVTDHVTLMQLAVDWIKMVVTNVLAIKDT